MKPLKFGIIGCSRIANRSVIPAILKSGFAQLETIGSRDPVKAEKFSNEFNCKKYGNYEDVISDNSVDIVYISTPIGTHEELAIKAIKNGKHVYCEKSLTTSFQSAKNIIEQAKKNNVRVIEGFMFRFHPQHEKVKELIDSNRIGEVVNFNGIFGFPKFPKGDIRYENKLGGGFLNDSGCYPICASRMIFDAEPIGVSCNLSIDEQTGVDVKGTSYIIFKNGKTASITYGNGNYYQAEYTIWGTDGIISLDRAFSVPPDFKTSINIQKSKDKNWNSRKNEKIEIQEFDHFHKLIDSFCLEIQGKQKMPYNFEEDILNQAKVLEAHRISNNERRFVTLDEIS